MPIKSHFRPDDKLVILVHEGPVEDDEFVEFYEELFSDVRLDKSFNLLVDLHKTQSSIRSVGALSEISSFIRNQYEGITTNPKVAVIAPKDVSFGLARMYKSFSSGVHWEFVVFRAADAALAWLGLQDDVIDDFR